MNKYMVKKTSQLMNKKVPGIGNRKHADDKATVDFLSFIGSIKTSKKALSSRELHDFVAEGMARERLDNI